MIAETVIAAVVPVPLLIPDGILAFIANLLGQQPAKVATGVGLVGALLYYKKMVVAGTLFRSVIGRIAFAVAVIGVLLLTGVIEGVNFGLVIDTGRGLFEWVWGFASGYL